MSSDMNNEFSITSMQNHMLIVYNAIRASLPRAQALQSARLAQPNILDQPAQLVSVTTSFGVYAMSERPIRFAIAGAGMVARYHATAIANTSGAQLVAICRSQAGEAAEAQAQFGAPCAQNYAALLARDDVDAVCICTPSGLHAEQTILAAQAGKHVL